MPEHDETPDVAPSEMERVIARVRKLLMVTKTENGATAEEADNAQRRVQEMLLKYNLDMGAIEASTGSVDTTRVKESIDGRTKYKWQRELAKYVAEANFCFHMLKSKRTLVDDYILDTNTEERYVDRAAVRAAGFDPYETIEDEAYADGQRERFKYVDSRWKTTHEHVIVGRKANVITAQLMYQYLTSTIEQVYYRLVAGGLIPNAQKEYDKVQSIITDARYAGLIDWDVIEDRNREAIKAPEWASGRAVLEGAIEQFRLDRWKTQPFYLELWVEKAALAGVLEPIAHDYHIVLMVNRGYSSASAMKESAERIRARSDAGGASIKRPVILYVGDHDPSGIDMVRDIGDRLREFRCPVQLDVRPIALTWDQIQQHNPPPNPVKLNDARAKEYIERFHTEECWEVDSLPPDTLDILVRSSINAYVDKTAMKKAITAENLIKKQINAFAKSFKEP